jgi:hypothetical protein
MFANVVTWLSSLQVVTFSKLISYTKGEKKVTTVRRVHALTTLKTI